MNRSAQAKGIIAGLAILMLATMAQAIPPVQVGVVQGTIFQAGVKCICPVAKAAVTVTAKGQVLGVGMSDSSGSFAVITNAAAQQTVYRIVATHPDFVMADTTLASDAAGNATVNLYMWAKTGTDTSKGAEWHSIGYPQQWVFIQAPTPVGYYGTLFAEAQPRTSLRDLYSPVVDVGPFDGKLTKVQGHLESVGILAVVPKLIVEKAELGQKDCMVIEYTRTSGSVSSQYQFMNILQIDETGHVTYTENNCPMCDYLPLPKIDTSIGILQMNELIDLFNANGFWGFDTIIRPLSPIIGGPGYTLACDGTSWSVQWGPDQQEQAIIDGLESFIKEIGGTSAVRRAQASRQSLSTTVRQTGASIQLAVPGTGPASIGIFDFRGRLIHSAKSSGPAAIVSSENIAPGIYTVRITQGGSVTVQRIALVP